VQGEGKDVIYGGQVGTAGAKNAAVSPYSFVPVVPAVVPAVVEEAGVAAAGRSRPSDQQKSAVCAILALRM
jgi:hypothetical protein